MMTKHAISSFTATALSFVVLFWLGAGESCGFCVFEFVFLFVCLGNFFVSTASSNSGASQSCWT